MQKRGVLECRVSVGGEERIYQCWIIAMVHQG